MPEESEETARLRGAIRDFLGAIDSGCFGSYFMVGPPDDRAESAFLVRLREVLNEKD